MIRKPRARNALPCAARSCRGRRYCVRTRQSAAALVLFFFASAVFLEWAPRETTICARFQPEFLAEGRCTISKRDITLSRFSFFCPFFLFFLTRPFWRFSRPYFPRGNQPGEQAATYGSLTVISLAIFIALTARALGAPTRALEMSSAAFATMHSLTHRLTARAELNATVARLPDGISHPRQMIHVNGQMRCFRFTLCSSSPPQWPVGELVSHLALGSFHWRPCL